VGRDTEWSRCLHLVQLENKKKLGERGEGNRKRSKINDEKKEERNGRNQVCRKKQRQETVKEREYYLGS